MSFALVGRFPTALSALANPYLEVIRQLTRKAQAFPFGIACQGD